MTVSWKHVTGAYKYYIGIADVTDSPNKDDINHVKIDQSSEVYGTSYTFGKPKVDFEGGRTYKIAVGATADKNGKVEDIVISGDWSWAEPIFVKVKETPVEELPEEAEINVRSPLKDDRYQLGSKVDIVAKIEGNKPSHSEVTITREGSSDPVRVFNSLISDNTITHEWDTTGYQEGHYDINLIVYSEYGKILAEGTTTISLNRPEEAQISFIKLASDVNYVDDVVSIVAKIEGNKISGSEVIITRAGSDEPIDVIKPTISSDYIIDYWHTIDCEEGKYDIHVIVYGESGNKLAESEISVVLIRRNSAKINVLSPNNSIKKKYEINSEILFEADIEGYGFEYTTFTVYSATDTKIGSSEKLRGPNISYLWSTTGYEVGEYYLLIQTYDSNNSQLARKKIDILLEEPKYVDIIPDSENIKEYLVNDEVVYKARVEGRGFTYARFFVRNKSNPSDIVYSIPKEIHNGEGFKFLWDTTGAEPGEYDVWIEVHCVGDDFGDQILSKLDDTIILRELPSAKIVKFSAEDESTYSSNDIVSLEAEVEGSGYEYFRYIVNSENDEPVYDTDITRGEITPVQWNTAGCDAGDYRAFVSIYDANENVLDFSTTKITLTDSKKVIYGDLDGNGEVNAIDFANMRKIVLGMISTAPSETLFELADVNGDGEVNAIDLAFLRKYVLGIIDEFPIEKKV